MNLRFREWIKLLPAQPGVYRFLNKEGTIIYIGKAKNLRNRVSQYFQTPESLTVKTRVMVSKIENIEHTIVESEEDALLLENNLIKKHQPRYNVMLKDSKTYPWICIKNEPFPRVFITRKYVRDGSVYFGPYSSASYAYNLIELINSIFYLRTCKLSLTDDNIKSKGFRPCLNYHIGKCKAPCIGAYNATEYHHQIESIKSILKGESAEIMKEFKVAMLLAAKDLRFEEAQLYKERIELIGRHYSKSLVVSQTITNVDVFTLAFENNFAFGNYMRVVNGCIIQSVNLEFKMPIEEEQSTILSLFIGEIRSKFGELSNEILVQFMPEDIFNVKNIHIPQRGDKLSLLELSLKNAKFFKLEKLKQEETLRPEEHKNRIMTALQRDLELPEPPVHIECFDNSNIQGKFAVAACVVFKNGIPSKSDYRHFNIKRVVGANDFATMKEVINRRYSRLLLEKEELPQLIVVDGGRGQLNFAYEALQELGLNKTIKIIGIAKRLEELIIPGDPHPLFLDKNSASLRVIMNLRDEAHRFGIGHHRNQRSKAQTESELRSIKGIGEKTEQKLLSRYKSLKSVRKAPYEDIKALVGVKAAEIIKNYFLEDK
ncbi:MAG: excinuclease ABC subunit C [Bacteroidetes bacterium GWF2_40_14]|nr:MAG: excinuclease ABC subunit C [Bacteroidetes bacterium GWF2_40_14]